MVYEQAQEIIDMTSKDQSLNKRLFGINQAEAIQKEQEDRKKLLGEKSRDQLTPDIQRNMRQFLKEKVITEKMKINMELIRRKLDFEVIKDNFENRVTQ